MLELPHMGQDLRDLQRPQPGHRYTHCPAQPGMDRATQKKEKKGGMTNSGC